MKRTIYDNADEALALYPRMARRCNDCAYTDGTEANATPLTVALARECTKARHAFWCHKSGETWFGGHDHLCAGWFESLSAAQEGESEQCGER